MSKLARRALLLMLLASSLQGIACEPKKVEPTPTPSPTPQPQTTPDAAQDQAAAQAPKEEKTSKTQAQNKVSADLDKAKALSQTYRKLLQQGRTQVQRKDYKAGIATFEEALKLDPNDARVLGELGFAALLDGQLDLAERANLASVRFAREDHKLKGASLYNLGRVAAERQDKERAAKYYRESLQVRPDNATVLAKLKALEVAAPDNAQPTLACELAEITSSADDLGALCKAYTKHTQSDPDGVLECDDPSDYQVVALGADGKAVVFSYEERDIFTRFYVLAVWHKQRWYARQLDMEYNPGAFGIGEELNIGQLELKQLVPGGKAELIFERTHARHDTDLGINEYEESETQHTMIVGFDGPGPLWLLDITTLNTYQRDFISPREEEEDGIEHTINEPVKRRDKLKLTFDATSGDLNVELAEGSAAQLGVTLGREALVTRAQVCLRD